jgi:hypothetical protein
MSTSSFLKTSVGSLAGSVLLWCNCSLVALPGVKCFDDLLGKEGTAKKGAMKGGAAATSSAGPIRHITGVHLGDGQPLSLSMQV